MIEKAKNRQKSYTILIVILLTFLIHALFLLLIFNYKYNNISIVSKPKDLIQHKQINQNQKTIKENNLNLANTLEKKGIPIFFVTEDQIKNKDQTKEEVNAQVSTEKKLSEKIEIKKDTKNLIQTSNEQLKKEIAKKDNKNQENKIEEIKKPKRKILSETYKPTLPKDFIQGLLDGNKGNNLFTYISNDPNNAKADFKLVSYIDRILSNIHNAWNIKKHKLKINKVTTLYFGISLDLDKNGNIESLIQTRSTGLPELDELMLETIRYAAPYPPIPKHLNKEYFNYSPTFYIEIKKYF